MRISDENLGGTYLTMLICAVNTSVLVIILYNFRYQIHLVFIFLSSYRTPP